MLRTVQEITPSQHHNRLNTDNPDIPIPPSVPIQHPTAVNMKCFTIFAASLASLVAAAPFSNMQSATDSAHTVDTVASSDNTNNAASSQVQAMAKAMMMEIINQQPDMDESVKRTLMAAADLSQADMDARAQAKTQGAAKVARMMNMKDQVEAMGQTQATNTEMMNSAMMAERSVNMEHAAQVASMMGQVDNMAQAHAADEMMSMNSPMMSGRSTNMDHTAHAAQMNQAQAADEMMTAAMAERMVKSMNSASQMDQMDQMDQMSGASMGMKMDAAGAY
ncbi:hypothetical protein B0T17DRAFT_241290 [Bombardia bombarda]|uniref:Uncharacterized protein n=1 Tax=Bombardia bombarda TaxID=252184 RepID=A0AA40CA38_9PEZI|nr:hypothetical protein B0T17DRAFT_241290 [Bombardia bombarda]